MPFDDAKVFLQQLNDFYTAGGDEDHGAITRKGYLINCELCKGSRHCQKHTPEFLREVRHK